MRHSPTRKWAIAAAGATAAGGLLAYAHWFERVHIELDRFTVKVDRRGLPPRGLTILHLSDFHFRAADRVQHARLARLRRLLRGQNYDILALTGDLIHDEAGLPTALAFLRTLHPRLGAFTVPGNRDYWESSLKAIAGSPEERDGLSFLQRIRLVLHKLAGTGRMFAGNQRAVSLRVRRNDVEAMHGALAQLNIRPLLNCATYAATRDGKHGIWIAGVDDFTGGRPDLDAALAEAPHGAPLLLLCHNPDIWTDPRAGRADVILSGHTHGGQLNFPLVGALYRQGTHVSRDKAAGWFERRDGTVMFVTRGIGESFPFRFGSRPQAALIRLVPVTGTGESL